MVSREYYRCISMLPLWFRANSGLSWPLQASSGGATKLGCRPQRRVRWDGAFVSTLLPWLRANSVAFRCCRCGFARIPASRGFFRPLVGGPLADRNGARGTGPNSVAFRCSCCGSSSRGFSDRNGARSGTGPWFRRSRMWFRANYVAFRCSRCGFARIPLRFDAPAVVSREFRCILMLPLWFRANSSLSWRLQTFSGGVTSLRLLTATARAVGRGLGFDAPAVVSRELRCVSMRRCGFA